MGEEFLANVKNIWKDLTNINTELVDWLVLCVFNIYVGAAVLPIITTSFSFFRTNIFSGCSRCSFMVDCVLIEREPYWGKDKWWRGGGGGGGSIIADHTVTTITIIQ